MGGRKLPHEEIVVAIAALVGLALAAGCSSSPSRATGEPSAAHAATTLATAPATTTTTPTPEVLATAPTSADEARAGIEESIRSGDGNTCPAELRARWNVRCATGDLDGDGTDETAFLVPLQQAAAASSEPAAVFVLLSRSQTLEEIRLDKDADASRLGQEFFGIERRAEGSASPQLSVLSAACNAAGCSYGIHVESFDGSGWRDIGPIDAIDDLDRVAFAPAGNAWTIETHTSPAKSLGAGPVRSITTRFAFDGKRFAVASQAPGPPVYLYSAIQDADAKFDEARQNTGDWAAAIDAYRAAITNKDLKDWQMETRNADGRSALDGYALFRIAVATAASGEDPTAAIDAAIRDAKDSLFAYGSEEFRQGFLEQLSVHAGCVAATRYFGLSSPQADNPAHIRQVFDYGYANLPIRKPGDLCPL